jgi:hypothetical protein
MEWRIFYDFAKQAVGGGGRIELMASFRKGSYVLSAIPQASFDTQSPNPAVGLAGQFERAFPYGSNCPGYNLMGLRPSLDLHLPFSSAGSSNRTNTVGPLDLGLMTTFRTLKQFLNGSGGC